MFSFFPPVVTDVVHSRCPQFQKECVLFITVMNLAINYPTSSFSITQFFLHSLLFEQSVWSLGWSFPDYRIKVFSFSLQLKCQRWNGWLLHLSACMAYNTWRKRQLFLMSSLLPNISHTNIILCFWGTWTESLQKYHLPCWVNMKASSVRGNMDYAAF